MLPRGTSGRKGKKIRGGEGRGATSWRPKRQTEEEGRDPSTAAIAPARPTSWGTEGRKEQEQGTYTVHSREQKKRQVLTP